MVAQLHAHLNKHSLSVHFLAGTLPASVVALKPNRLSVVATYGEMQDNVMLKNSLEIIVAGERGL